MSLNGGGGVQGQRGSHFRMEILCSGITVDFLFSVTQCEILIEVHSERDYNKN